MTHEERIREALRQAVASLGPEAAPFADSVELEIPASPEHGDLASNAALLLAKPLRRPPRAIAEEIAGRVGLPGTLVAKTEVAGPGFLNFTLAPEALAEGLQAILEAGERWGATDLGGGAAVQVEYVSANPTGPLNVVNARAAAVGSTLVNLFRATGHDARSEFYVNDVGTQITLLGASLYERFVEARGERAAVIPEEGYRGAYLADLARGLVAERCEGGPGTAETIERFARVAVDRLVRAQEEDLRAYGVTFDRWYFQSELYRGEVDSAREALERAGATYEAEGATWLRSTVYGDEKDRVLVRSNGEPTYLLADIAYHRTKRERGFRQVVDLWGPDHHGHIPRMAAAMRFLGADPAWLEILIVQQVNLLSGGEAVKMSKRMGEFVPLRELIEEVGVDAARFFFLMRRTNSPLDFDLDLAKKETDENPVFYVKYAHARIASILRFAKEEGTVPLDRTPDFARLTAPEERSLLRLLLDFPILVRGAVRAREPHRLTTYLRQVAQAFHHFYHVHRVVGPDPDLSRARLGLVEGVRATVRNGLTLLGVSAPESM